MLSRILCLMLFSSTLNVTEALADGIRIDIKNSYNENIDFGPLGKAKRDGVDRVEGVLNRQGANYVGTLNANIVSTQTTSGMTGSCGPETYVDWQTLKVTGRPVDGFNSLVQTITFIGQTAAFNQATGAGRPTNASDKYLVLEFVPETMPTKQPGPRLPGTTNEDLVVACHTLIDTLSGISFLPLNDSRWTMEGGGYIVMLPSSGVITYTDDTVAAGHSVDLGPFKANKSVWTIQVERLP